jgi:hypothetical protein
VTLVACFLHCRKRLSGCFGLVCTGQLGLKPKLEGLAVFGDTTYHGESVALPGRGGREGADVRSRSSDGGLGGRSEEERTRSWRLW